MKRSNALFRELLLASALALCVSTAAAKLPVAPETPESKAKADEAKEKAAAAAKTEADQLAGARDKAVANYKARAAK